MDPLFVHKLTSDVITSPSLIAFKRRLKTLLSAARLISDSLTPVLILRDTVIGFIFSVKCS